MCIIDFKDEADNTSTVNGELLVGDTNDLNLEVMRFQKDGATCHTSETLALLQTKLPGRENDWSRSHCDTRDSFTLDHMMEGVYQSLKENIRCSTTETVTVMAKR